MKEEGGRRKENLRKTTSLEELTKETVKGRRKKVREKERFEQAGWKSVENILRWRWTYHKVPHEKKQMMISLPPSSCHSRLSVFSLYFSDEFLSYIICCTESEMAANWSPLGYGVKLNLQIM